MTEFQHEDAASTAEALRDLDGKLSQMSEEQGNESGLWRTRYALSDELKLHEKAESGGQPLTPTQVRAFDALMNGASQAEAAKAAGKTARWLYHQMHTSGPFRDAYFAASKQIQKAVRHQAIRNAGEVMGSLVKVAKDPTHKDFIKAATLVLNLTDCFHKKFD